MNRDESGDIVSFERGDVVWGIDPFKQDSHAHDETSSTDGSVAPRPWLIISSDSVPFHPDQYLCMSLSSRTWHDESISIEDDDWLVGGAPANSSLLPWSVSAVLHSYLDTTGELVTRLDADLGQKHPQSGFQGQLRQEIVDTSVTQLSRYLAADLDSSN